MKRRVKILLTENILVFFIPVAFDLKLSLKSHGWVYLSPWELDNNDLLRVEDVSGEKIRIKIKQLNKQKLEIRYDSAEVKPRKHLKKLVWQWFSLNDDYKDFISFAKNLDPRILPSTRILKNLVNNLLNKTKIKNDINFIYQNQNLIKLIE